MTTKPQSNQITYDSGTVQDVLDTAKTLQNYTALRAYSGRATHVRITTPGIAGFFHKVPNTGQADNGGTVIVDGAGRRWKRVFDGSVKAGWFGIVGDNATDNTVQIAAAVDFISSRAAPNNGGVLEFDAGIFLGNISLKPRVFLLGQGYNATVIRSMPITTNAVLYVPVDSFFNGWSGITFDGDKAGGAVCNGIEFQDAPTGVGSVNDNTFADKTITGNSAYKFINAKDFAAVNAKNDGIKLGSGNYGVFFSDFYAIRNDKSGMSNRSTDNIFHSFYSEHNGMSGLYNRGSNNKFIGAKLIWNGKLDQLSSGGLNDESNRCDFIGVECQDNFCDGARISGLEGNYDLLLDSNGYKVTINPDGSVTTDSNASSRAHTNLRVTNVRSAKIKACISHYRGDPLADGYRAAEYPYVVTGYNQFDLWDVSVKENSANAAPLGEVFNTRESDFVVCNRSTSVTQSGQTFTADVPAIVKSTGVYVSGDDKIELFGTCAPGKSLSYCVDFVYDGRTGDSSVIVAATADLSFAIYYIPTGVLAPRFEVRAKVGNDVVVSSIRADLKTGVTLAASDFYAGNLFTITGNLKIVDTYDFKGSSTTGDVFGTNGLDGTGYTADFSASKGVFLVREEVVRTYGVDGKEKLVRQVTTSSISAGLTFGEISNVVINDGSSTQRLIGKIKGVAVWSSDESSGAYLTKLPGSGVHNYADTKGIYADFTNYAPRKNPSSFIRLTLPTASEYYRWSTTIKDGGASFADAIRFCRKSATNTYEWVSLA